MRPSVCVCVCVCGTLGVDGVVRNNVREVIIVCLVAA